MASAEPTVTANLTATPAGPRRPLARTIGDDVTRRIMRFVGVFRVAVTAAMLAVALIYRDPPLLGVRSPELFVLVAQFYLIFALLALGWHWRRPVVYPRLELIEIAIDTLAVTLLMHASGGVTSGIGGLLVVFVGAASLMLGGRYALLVASLATIAVLTEQSLGYSLGVVSIGEFIPAGMLGGVVFLIASAALPLARRLEESEALAAQRGIDLQNLAQLNDYIIQNLRESIVVVDESNRIRLINQSAAEQLGLNSREPGQDLAKVAPRLSRVVNDWRRQGNPLRQPPPFLAADESTRITTHVAPLGASSGGPVLVFLEDASLLTQKVQQSKLAALGRLSASIAHEIRNPVGALSHASQLLEESPAIGEHEQRLVSIIQQNSKRVSEIVENVLQLSRRESSRPELLYLGDWAHEFAREFTSTLELFENQVSVLPAEDAEVRMDPGHLRQVVWNLCENAVKYASESAGGIAVEISYGRMPGSRRPYLAVADRGSGIADELVEQMFEPFATGRIGGTGLGLFISRELCELNRAALTYEPRRGGGSVFRIVFADPARWES